MLQNAHHNQVLAIRVLSNHWQLVSAVVPDKLQLNVSTHFSWTALNGRRGRHYKGLGKRPSIIAHLSLYCQFNCLYGFGNSLSKWQSLPLTGVIFNYSTRHRVTVLLYLLLQLISSENATITVLQETPAHRDAASQARTVMTSPSGSRHPQTVAFSLLQISQCLMQVPECTCIRGRSVCVWRD